MGIGTSAFRLIVAATIRGRKRAALMQEIEKCELVCANCHFEIEHEEWIKGR